MNLKKTLATGALVVGGLGVVATANDRLRRTSELDQPLPGEDRVYRWRGMDVPYVEYGDPADEDLLLVHGVNAAATSMEFTAVWEDLAEEYHVIAPDLPGFGRSDRPPLVYSAALYEAFVADFARDVTDDPICLASSLSGAYAVQAADIADFAELILVCPTANPMPGGRRLPLRTLLRSPVVGTAAFNLLGSRRSIDHFGSDHGFYDVANKPAALSEYQYRTAHRPGARFAPASFVSGYLDADVDLGEAIADLDVPVTLVWGREAEITPLRDGRDLAGRPGASLVVVDYAKLQPHVEHPEEFLEAIELGRTEASATTE
jgi:pimeloyl-ACP methyl ester carboxylesterase